MLLLVGLGITTIFSLNQSSYALSLNGNNVSDINGIIDIGNEDWKDSEPALVTKIKRAINIVLGFMSLITLIILLWGGFQMVTANGDDGKFQAGTKLLRQAALGLLFIAVSWMMVSMIFWIIGQVGAGNK